MKAIPEPRRIQLSRRKGWRMPPDTITVARPSVYGNPFKATDYCQHEAVNLFRHWIGTDEQESLRERARQQLRGKNLACWCKSGTPCHADVWLELVNRP